jgi:4-hydroxymandelate oxidase
MEVESVADLVARYEQACGSSIPQAAYDFIAGGSGEEISQQEAVGAWRNFRLRPHVLRNVEDVDTSTTALGTPLRAPVIAAPIAYHSVAHSDGEIETARGVSAAGSLMIVPTRASTPLADIARALGGPWWFQVYFVRDRELTRRIVADAVELGATALVLTGDTPYVGQKRRGQLPPIAPEHYLVNFGKYMQPDAEFMYATSQDPTVILDAVQWLRDVSGLPVIVKGLLRGDDAAACVEAGAAGVIVSNHGGRQLDRAVPAVSALAEVVAAVGDRGEVFVDGGVRSGIDVLIALSLGARAVMLGRPVLWALGAEGAPGVERVLRGLRDELSHAMALAGVNRTANIDRSLVR